MMKDSGAELEALDCEVGLADQAATVGVPDFLDDQDLGDCAASRDEPAIYGTFFVGGAELAVETRWLREVVPFPETIAPVPLTAAAVLGIFSLRGETMPIVDLGAILGEQGSTDLESRRVAIIDDGRASLGVVVDRTGEVVRPCAEDLQAVEHESSSRGSVIGGVLSLEGGSRFVQLLSVQLLGDLDDIPRASSISNRSAVVEEIEFESAVVAQVGDFQFAFPMAGMFEIQDNLPVKPSPEYFEFCEGVVQVRGELRPVMNLRGALGLPKLEGAERVLFLRDEASCVGLVVDALIETLEYPVTARLPLPTLLESSVTKICNDVLSLEDGGRHLFLVEPSALFREFNIHNADASLGAVAEDDGALVGSEHEGSFLTFQVASHSLSIALEEVSEVHEQGEGVFMSWSSDGGVIAGLMNVRGRVVPLVDMAVRLDVEPATEHASRVIVVVEDGDVSYGLLVDKIQDIARVASATAWDQHKLPGRLVQNQGVMSCLKTTLLVDQTEDATESQMLAVLDVQKVVSGAPLPDG